VGGAARPGERRRGQTRRAAARTGWLMEADFFLLLKITFVPVL